MKRSEILDIARALIKSRSEPIIGLTIWLAVLSVLLTIHSDIFEQEQHPMWAILTKPISRLIAPAPSPVNLSALLTPKPAEDTKTQSDSQIAPPNPLYVFALDVSASMSQRKAQKEEVAEYIKDLQSSKSYVDTPRIARQCYLTDATASATSFDIARSELCRYINSVPDFSDVALWTFGDNAKLIVPKESRNGNTCIPFKPNDQGGHTRTEITDPLSGMVAGDKNTDFVSLFDEFYDKYKKDIVNKREVHFIIVSDFDHDTAGFDYVTSMVGKTSEAPDSPPLGRNGISAVRIADRLRDLSQNGNQTFHLAVVSGARRAIFSILPIVETLGIYSYRETQLTPYRTAKEFDFLRAYKESSVPITFYYTAGSFSTSETEIRIDDEKYKESFVRFTLAVDAQAVTPFPLTIKALFNSERNRRPDILRLDGVGCTGPIAHAGDSISLIPVTTLNPREAAAYRLMISWDGSPDGKVNETNNKTFAARIVFHQRLSSYGALGILMAEVLVLISLVRASLKAVRVVKEHLARERSPRVPDAQPVSNNVAYGK